MTARGEGTIDTTALQTITHRLRDGASRYAPRAADDTGRLPGRSPGEALSREPRVPVGPRAVILDCGTSRVEGYTHVLLIAASAELMLGSHVVSQVGVILGRVLGVEAYRWEGNELLHLRAPGLQWDDLLRESRDALADYLAAA
ncbi:hypothetical protein LGT39_02560 [Demequina sp. TTPB684]|uniref:hypothetical protein n=1 Tax=unclassified Demequina TaxID=2620311 RepID=UPI001CF3BA1D|nr:MULTISPECIES: hypothetical protein [unclassified Demequina]MCB2411730.1 hypothetical protein [Demequina sp. TTPB684]UPU87626.1 hypothetical protein LGT36_010225 [Demequina sp. TMPB413]